MTNFSPVIDYEMRFVKMQFSKIDITMTTIKRKLQIDKTWITTGNVCCGVFFVDWATLGRGKFDLGANAPCPGAVSRLLEKESILDMAWGNVHFQQHAWRYFAFKLLLRCSDGRSLPLVEKICDLMGFRAANRLRVDKVRTTGCFSVLPLLRIMKRVTGIKQ